MSDKWYSRLGNSLKELTIKAGNKFSDWKQNRWPGQKEALKISFKNWNDERKKQKQAKKDTPYAFGPFSWSVVMRILASITAGLVSAVIVSIILNWIMPQSLSGLDLLGQGRILLLAGIFAALFAMSSKNDYVVVPPTRYAAQLLWLGIALPAYLRSGEYYWLGRRLFFGVSGKKAKSFTDENGFIIMGGIPFRVWDDADAPINTERRTWVTAPARNEAESKSAITIEVKVYNPRLLLNNENPAVALGDRARQEWREIVSNFVDTDLPRLQQALPDILEDKAVLITSFIGTPTEGVKTGSMIRDNHGKPIYELFYKHAKDRKEGFHPDLEKAEEAFCNRVLREAQPKMRNKVVKKVEIVDPATGEVTETRTAVLTESVEAKNPITEVLNAIGTRIERISIADIDFSEKVKNAAAQASAEQNEYISQLQSARTIKAVRKELMPSKAEVSNPGYELSTVLAAAQDSKNDSVKVVFVPGGNKLASAFVAGASQIGGKDVE